MSDAVKYGLWAGIMTLLAEVCAWWAIFGDVQW